MLGFQWVKDLDQLCCTTERNFNKSASKALEQIKERNYLDKVREYSSKVMMLGISYDAKSKKHKCVIENV